MAVDQLQTVRLEVAAQPSSLASNVPMAAAAATHIHYTWKDMTLVHNKGKGKGMPCVMCIASQVNYSTSEALSMDHTALYTANTPCRLYRVVRHEAPRLNEQL